MTDQMQNNDQQQQQLDQQQQAAAPEWMGALGDETLRGNEHLARYKTVDDLAKGHIETMTWARGRVPLPKGDDEAGRADFIAKARPEKWEDYGITVPEGQDKGRAEGYMQKAHELGLMPWQAKALSDWNTAHEGDAVSRMQQAAKDELKTREVNLGPAGYERSNAAIQTMLGQIEGIDPEKAIAGLEQAYGAGAAWDMLRHFAEKTGELEKVSGADIEMRLGTMSAPSAQAEINRLMADKDFMAKASQAGSAENRRWNDLNRAASAA